MSEAKDVATAEDWSAEAAHGKCWWCDWPSRAEDAHPWTEAQECPFFVRHVAAREADRYSLAAFARRAFDAGREAGAASMRERAAKVAYHYAPNMKLTVEAIRALPLAARQA